MHPDRPTVATVRHRAVVPWRRDGFERTLLRRDEVTAVFHATHHLEVTFRCDREHAVAVLDEVVLATRFPVVEVTFAPAEPGEDRG